MNRCDVSGPCSLFLWRRGHRSGPSFGALGRRGRPIRSCASWEPRDCLGAGAAAGVRIAVDRLWARPRLGRCQGCTIEGGLGRHESRDSRDLGVQCRGLERAADRGYSVRTQWPVIPAVPCPSRYGADATLGPVGHSAVSSHRPAEIAGVVGVLMGHDVLSGRPAEAGATGYGRTGLERYGE